MDRDLYLHEFRPQPKLSVPATPIERPRFPVIAPPNPLGPDFGGAWSERPAAELLDALDQADVRVYVDLDGGWGEDILNQRLERFKSAAPERFRMFGGVDWSAWPEHGDRFGEWAAARFREQVARGAEGRKNWKPVGLPVRGHDRAVVLRPH